MFHYRIPGRRDPWKDEVIYIIAEKDEDELEDPAKK